jgi:Tfp pilus assembly protein PilN
MIRINLLPAEIEVLETKTHPVVAASVVLVLLVMVLSPISWSLNKRKSDLQNEAASLQSDIDRYKPVAEKVDALEKTKAERQQRKTIIEQLQNERLRYPQFMEDFLKLLPGNVWLTNLVTSQQGDAMNVSMDVVALDNYAIADLISNLETSQIFTAVDLGTITLSQSATGQTLTFHVNTMYKKMELTANAFKKS